MDNLNILKFMTKMDFEKLSVDLQKHSSLMPLHWGAIQNDAYDSKIQMFKITSFDELENEIQHLPDEHKNYFRRRWFLWRCSQCDEYLFSLNNNVGYNPNPYDKSYDIIINETLKFDIKGTVIPDSLRENVDECIEHPQQMIDFFYTRQSQGVRYGIQNRLFIVHHSFVDEARESQLRCAWHLKELVYKKFAENIEQIKFRKYKDSLAAVIFIVERISDDITYVIDGL